MRTIRAGLACALVATSAHAGSVVLEPLIDNTLIEPNPDDPMDPPPSSGIGPLFSGSVGMLGGFTARRALIMFDVASIPPGAIVECAQVTLHLDQTNTGGHEHTLHRMLASWGEGTSGDFGGAGSPATPGDATWEYRFWPVAFWTTPGGDFIPAPSASAIVPLAPGPVTWGPAPGLAADVQAWVDGAPSDGWILIGDERTPHSAKRFFSGEWVDSALRPTLHVRYRLPGSCDGDVDDDGLVGFQDLLAVLGAWGPVPACASADLDDDGAVGFTDLLLILTAWGACG